MQTFHDDINQNLRKIGPQYSATGEKQNQFVQMIKRFEVQPELRCRINMDIPGLVKKKTPFSDTPNNKRLWDKFSSRERNGMVNQWLSRNWVRFVFPMVPAFFFIYMMQPIIHGNINQLWYQNYNHETVYYKYGTNRMQMTDNSITRIA